MNIIDSSGWLEYFSDGPNTKYYLPPLNDTSSLIVPVITICEVFKVVFRYC
jgi:toxin FitB